MIARTRSSCKWPFSRTISRLLVLALTGCFGPPTMHYDIQEYNKQILSSEEQMLLYNIAMLHENQPPHFMMLSNISQTRSFSAAAAFQWTHANNSIVTAPDTYQVGPFAAGSSESPTFSFVPIQGADFAQRFESTVTDKLTYFIEDLNYGEPGEETQWLFLLFAQALEIDHGDDIDNKGHCHHNYPNANNPNAGVYLNRAHSYDAFARCVAEIIEEQKELYLTQIDANHPIPTATPKDQPAASDVLAALQANYKWAKLGDGYMLVNPVKIPALLDYQPKFVSPAESSDSNSASEVVLPEWWSQRSQPDWQRLAYKLPANYQWYQWRGRHVLVPEGSVPQIRKGRWSLQKIKPAPSPNTSEQFSYGDQIVRNLWPTPYDVVYVELRKHGSNSTGGVDDAVAQRECADQPPSNERNDVICGFFKIGNVGQILQRLGEMACIQSDSLCPDSSVAAIGDRVPGWATNSAPYGPVGSRRWIWIPAHNPQSNSQDPKLNEHERRLGQRDEFMFLTLYKLYQMSLVDTSKLVTGQIPITISK
jgi:hypothetical protein